MKKKNLFLIPMILIIGLVSCEKLADTSEVEAHERTSQLKASSYHDGYFPLFQLFLGKSNADCDTKVNAMWNHFFGQSSAERIYYEVTLPGGTPGAYIYNEGQNSETDRDVRSEGMSYAMMICVQLNKKPEFDRLWNWAKMYMRKSDNFFKWRVRTNGDQVDANPAPDGEEYFALALYFANNRWGGSDYKSSADNILGAMLNNSTPMFGSNNLICFQPVISGSYNGTSFTDPSYHLPLFYDLFAEYGPGNQTSRWQQIASASRTYLASVISKNSRGLVPDYSDFSGNPTDPLNGGHEDFKQDAWRTIMNVTMDALYGNSELYGYGNTDFPLPCDYANNFLYFIETQRGVNNTSPFYPANYSLSGSPLVSYYSEGLIAMNAVGARMMTNWHPIVKYAQDFWDVSLPSGIWRYYNGCLYMLGMLWCTGSFQIIDPGNVPRPAPEISFPYPVSFSSSWSGKHITVVNQQNNADIKAQPENTGWTSQDWIIEDIYASDYVRIKNVWSGKYLNVQNQNENAKIVCYDLNNSWTSQQWKIVHVTGTSKVRLQNVWSGKYLTVVNTGDYADIIAKSLNSGWTSQEWMIK